MNANKEEILLLCVIGFHHKKGCQLEFAYPNLQTLPEPWKMLPSLALPDGAHNFESDVVYFHVSSLTSPVQTVFGISCFQQIPIEKVKKKTADMTRGAVQKAVCILSTVPLYGYIKVKMELITAAFFDGGDFSQTDLLVDAFHHLNDCLPGSLTHHLHEGLSVKDLVVRFRHQALILFKLLLLERKVVLFHSPVKPLCNTLLSLLSLYPGLIEFGLYEASSISSPTSPSITVPFYETEIEGTRERNNCGENSECQLPLPNEMSAKEDGVPVQSHEHQNVESTKNSLGDDASCESGLDAMLIEDYFAEDSSQNKNSAMEANKDDSCPNGCDIDLVQRIDFKSCGLPLNIFSKGNLCFPYLSISYLDFLAGAGVRGFVAGATNVLFKQKREISDIVIDMEERKLETACPELRRQLPLTTEDLRFMEQVLRGIAEPGPDMIDDDWIRAHFHLYLVSLLRTSLLQDGSKEIDQFNQHFVAAWKNTHNYKMWFGLEHDGVFDINPGHPGAGSLSVQDVRLRLSQAVMSSESGRKLNQAVSTTGKAIGGALTQARGAISGWWNNMVAQDGKPVTKSIENI